MTIGISTYALFWQWQSSADRPLTLTEMIDKIAGWGAELFQICDYPLIEAFSPAELAALKQQAAAKGVALELGTRGVTPDHLGGYLDLARALDVTLVRSMLNTIDHRPTTTEAVGLLREIMPAYEAAGVTVALETYEQVPVARLIDVVEQVRSPALGICLDPGNCVAPSSFRPTRSPGPSLTCGTCTSRTSPSPAKTAGSASPSPVHGSAKVCSTTTP